MLNIWYLDDEKDLCEIFVDLFESPTCHVTPFTDCQKLFDYSKTHRPDLIFIDFILSFTTGDRIAFELDSKIPKFLVTGDLSVESTYRFEECFQKPFENEKIKKVIDRYTLLLNTNQIA